MPDYDINHPALRIEWWFLPPYSETADYKGHKLRVQHRGQDPDGYPTMHCGFIDGKHQFNDAVFQRLVIRLAEKVDRLS